MSRRRYITTDISIDKDVNRMGAKYGDGPVLLYTWLIAHATDDATIKGDPFEILGMVWPSRRDKTEEDVVAGLMAMEEFNLIAWEPEEQRIYFPIKSFYKHQSYVKDANRRKEDHPRFCGEQRKTPPIIEECRQTAENTDEQRELAENTVSLSLSLSPSHSNKQQQQHTDVREGEENKPIPQQPIQRDPEGYMVIHKAIQTAFGRLPTEFLVSKFLLFALDDKLELTLVIRAIEQSALAQKDSRHANNTLESWREKGILTVEAAERELQDYRASKEQRGQKNGVGEDHIDRSSNAAATRETAGSAYRSLRLARQQTQNV